MKRPEGFDPRRSPEPDAPSGRPAARRGTSRGRAGSRDDDRAASASVSASTSASGSSSPAASSPAPAPERDPSIAAVTAAAIRKRMRAGERARSASAPAAPDDRHAARMARRAARERRRFERGEVRRFTRRSRRRKIAWATTAGITVVMVALVAVAVYSPLLALKTIEVEGTSRLDAAAVREAIDGQLETPLALVDFDRMTDELGVFPLIRSYVTETIPPDTIVVHIVEREPIGSVTTSSGFALVDPAGIVIERSEARIPGFPLLDASEDEVDGEGFAAAVEVLLALPESVLDQVDTVAAESRDDVELSLVSTGGRIMWGDSDNSAYKARLLEVLVANYPDASEYNVSAEGQGSITP
ncbi:FtsQ-type POTRA domain-containing protein [Marisediminicola sp. LYQ134]|uniref:FtsQ-type POTRA domain-containing protein n=1 Tax=Marisediminicola sp. LYQ134 TaxID=3391061 RepID=UPI003983B916